MKCNKHRLCNKGQRLKCELNKHNNAAEEKSSLFLEPPPAVVIVERDENQVNTINNNVRFHPSHHQQHPTKTTLCIQLFNEMEILHYYY